MKNSTFPNTLSKTIALSTVAIFHFLFLPAQSIITVAGNGTPAYYGDGGQATAAEIQNPAGVYVDGAGNLYFADQGNNCIRKVNSSGIISTVGGNNNGGFSGDGGQATAAEISSPQGIFADRFGNIFFTDFFNNRVREINTSGVINTLAGLGVNSYSGDGGPASVAELNAPSGVVTDTLGNVYIADEANNRIRMINTSGIINTFAGNGTGAYSGDGGQATDAEIDNITGVAIDANQNIYIADLGNDVIRKVNTSGVISTVAGIAGIFGFSGDGGQATAAELSSEVTGVCVDGLGDIYIGDYYRVRMINTSGIINTVAGNGVANYSGDGGPATAAELDYAFSVTADINGDFWFGDVFNNRVRKVTSVLTGVASISPTNIGVNLYPNPNNGRFTIEWSVVSGQSSVEVFNVLGKEVLRTTLNPSTTQLDMNKQATGIYLYKIISETGDVIWIGKFVIE